MKKREEKKRKNEKEKGRGGKTKGNSEEKRLKNAPRGKKTIRIKRVLEEYVSSICGREKKKLWREQKGNRVYMISKPKRK
jgi:hypothetical protein